MVLQFSTLSRALDAIGEARRLGLAVMLGAPVGLHVDASFLAAFAVATGIGQIKFGGLASGECVERYNHVLMAAEDALPVPLAFVGDNYRR